MITDLLLAIAHHLLVFAILAVLVMELMLARPDMTTPQVLRLGRLDMAYGGLATAIILIGIGRVFFGVKPWEFYIYNWAFWAKMAAFLAVGAISALPTMKIARWRTAVIADPAFRPPADEIAGIRRYMHWEAIVFILIPIFAAMMARGVGM